jgi:AraC-like DNA-binding protein
MSNDLSGGERQPASIALVERSYRDEPGVHRHSYFQLILPRHGEMLLRIDGSRLTLGSAHWLLLPPGVEHVYWAERPNRVLVADMAVAALPVACEGGGNAAALVRPLNERIAALAALLQSELRAGDLVEPLLAEQLAAYVDASLALALRPPRSPAPAPTNQRLAARARDYLEAHALEPVTMDALARAVGASIAHLQRCFRAAYGVSIITYLQSLRLRHAQLLLRQSDLPVDAVAATVGFASPSYFSRLFTRELGVSPGQFRRGG